MESLAPGVLGASLEAGQGLRGRLRNRVYLVPFQVLGLGFLALWAIHELHPADAELNATSSLRTFRIWASRPGVDPNPPRARSSKAQRRRRHG